MTTATDFAGATVPMGVRTATRREGRARRPDDSAAGAAVFTAPPGRSRDNPTQGGLAITPTGIPDIALAFREKKRSQNKKLACEGNEPREGLK